MNAIPAGLESDESDDEYGYNQYTFPSSSVASNNNQYCSDEAHNQDQMSTNVESNGLSTNDTINNKQEDDNETNTDNDEHFDWSTIVQNTTYDPWKEKKIDDGDNQDDNNRPLDFEGKTIREIEEYRKLHKNNNSDEDEDVEYKLYGDIELFLTSIDEDGLEKLFRQHKVTFSQLLQFEEQDLINVGIDKVGDRKKILEAIDLIHASKWEPTCLSDLTSRDLLTSPGIYIVLNDINKHMEYIGASLSYIYFRLEKNPAILELGKDFVGIEKISSELKDLVKTSRTTYMDMIRLNNHLAKFRDNPTFLPPDYVYREVKLRSPSPGKSKIICCTLIVSLATVFALKFAFSRIRC